MAADVRNADVAKDLREMVANILETDPASIDPGANFVKDLGMDSMMALEILAGIEKKYKIVIPEDLLPKFTDLNQTTAIVKGILNKK